jgi:hypothetical protein
MKGEKISMGFAAQEVPPTLPPASESVVVARKGSFAQELPDTAPLAASSTLVAGSETKLAKSDKKTALTEDRISKTRDKRAKGREKIIATSAASTASGKNSRQRRTEKGTKRGKMFLRSGVTNDATDEEPTFEASYASVSKPGAVRVRGMDATDVDDYDNIAEDNLYNQESLRILQEATTTGESSQPTVIDGAVVVDNKARDLEAAVPEDEWTARKWSKQTRRLCIGLLGLLIVASCGIAVGVTLSSRSSSSSSSSSASGKVVSPTSVPESIPTTSPSLSLAPDANMDVVGSIPPMRFETHVPTTSPVPTGRVPSLVEVLPPTEPMPSRPVFVPDTLPQGNRPHQTAFDPSSAPSEWVPDVLPPPACFLQIQVDCDPGGKIKDCNSIPPLQPRCQYPPSRLDFRYNGGDCSHSRNMQTNGLFQCQDFHGTQFTNGTISHIVVQGNGGEIFYEGFVAVGGVFSVTNNGNEVEPVLNISIYDSSDTTPDALLQTAVFDSSCSELLFLNDRFGATQLVEFENNRQGITSSFFNVTFEFVINSSLQDGDITVNTFNVVTNFAGLLNFTEELMETVIAAGNSSAYVSSSFQIDLTERQHYTVFTLIVSTNEMGEVCADTNFLEFSAGYDPSNPGYPSASPSMTPTSTPLPTSTPEYSYCSLDPMIKCRVVEGPLQECKSLAAPTSEACTSGDLPIALQFRYVGGTCSGNSGQDNLTCTGSADVNNVWITITTMLPNSNHTGTLFDQASSRGGFINIRGPDREMEIRIFQVANDAPGELLQLITMQTSCAPENSLTLKNRFGSLELVGFLDEDSQNFAYAEISIEYTVSTLTSDEAIITNATSFGAFVGEQTLVSLSPEEVGPRDVLRLGDETALIDLIANQGVLYEFMLNLEAFSSANSVNSCPSTIYFDFTIGLR